MQIKVLHLSDTHAGHFWKYPIPSDVDVVCHTGDLFPDAFLKEMSIATQTAWIKNYIDEINIWIGSRPLLYVQGNHDFVHLKDFVKSIELSSTPISLLGEQWCGLAEVPWINGRWNNEADLATMAAAVDRVISAPGTILLSHTPPASILAQEWGCQSLTSQLFYRENQYKAVLFGHVHLPQYQQLKLTLNDAQNCLFSNAAVRSLDESVNLRGFQFII